MPGPRTIIATLRSSVRTLRLVGEQVAVLQPQLDQLQAQLGGLEARNVAALGPDEIGRAEFQVFSQFGEDGIIQFLVQRVPIENEVFVELGVGDYRESNTRFLLVHGNWRGLVIDAANTHLHFLGTSGLAWRHDIDAKAAFIDRDNVNDVISSGDIEGDIGLLSIDLDGNDYWILDALDVVSPRVLVAEYNSMFGPEAGVTVPYDPSFQRSQKHWSWLYFGASLAALTELAREKGLALVGTTRAGNNAFFVRRDVLGEIPELSVAAAWRPSRFRESRDPAGDLSYVRGHQEQLRLISELPLFDTKTGREVTVAERFGLR